MENNLKDALNELIEKYKNECALSDDDISTVAEQYELDDKAIIKITDILCEEYNINISDNNKISSNINFENKYTYVNKNILSAQIAFDYLTKQYIDEGYSNFRQYVRDKYNLNSKDHINAYRRIGINIIARDNNGLPLLSGESKYKVKYGFDSDFSFSALVKLSVLSDEEIEIVFNEYGVTPESTVSYIRQVIAWIQGKNKPETATSEKQETDAYIKINRIYMQWPDEIKNKIFENELKKRYGISTQRLDYIIRKG